MCWGPRRVWKIWQGEALESSGIFGEERKNTLKDDSVGYHLLFSIILWAEAGQDWNLHSVTVACWILHVWLESWQRLGNVGPWIYSGYQLHSLSTSVHRLQLTTLHSRFFHVFSALLWARFSRRALICGLENTVTLGTLSFFNLDCIPLFARHLCPSVCSTAPARVKICWMDERNRPWIQVCLDVQIRSVAQSCPTLCDPMNRSTPGLPVPHQLPEFTQTHVHRVSDAIQPSHPLLSPSSAPNPSQHQSLFQWVNSSHEVAKVLEFQL